MRPNTLLFSALFGLGLAQSCPDPGVNGFASQNGGTTGGGSAAPITVTTAADLRTHAKASGPRVIIVKGTINTGEAVSVTSDKTIRGFDASATIVGGFDMNGVKNIILKNMNIKADALLEDHAQSVWGLQRRTRGNWDVGEQEKSETS